MVAAGSAPAGTSCQIVLAAGRSLRMGSPKPLLRFGERTALELALEAARSAGVSSRVVVLGSRAEEVEAVHRDAPSCRGVVWARNADLASEQLRSLQIGIEAAWRAGPEPPASFFVHPVDFPLARASDYLLLLEAMARDPGSATVFILSHGGRRGHPILCRARVAPKLLALDAQATARDAIEKEAIVYVVTANSGVREDMDTPGDYERLRRAFLESPQP